MNIALFIKLFLALFAIMNPFVNLPIFLSVAKSKDHFGEVRLALLTSTSIFIMLLVIAIGGKEILSFFGITIAGFKVAGGIILFLIAYAMLNAKSIRNNKDPNPAIVPIATPVMVGPGAISQVIAISSKATHISDYTAIFAAIGTSSLLVLSVFASGTFIAKLLGTTGMNIITRITAILIAALAAEMVLEGLQEFFFLSR
jgi:multiple antibiotic resistance protein